jgi:hypothetical protein
VTAATQAGSVLDVRVPADVSHERDEALVDARRFELVAQHRRQRQRQRRAGVEQLEQREIAADDRLPQPLLAERPRAEALDVRHMRVQHDRQRPAIAARAQRAHG